MEAVPKKKVAIKVNGVEHVREVEPRLLLVHFLRDSIGLTGTHIGCETSVCGACTVMLGNSAVKSCTVLTVQANGADVLTVEGLAEADKLHPIKEAFWECHGLQCGYCTSGMILSAYQLLLRNPAPTEQDIRHALDGNLCRCTGYQHIVDAVELAAKKMKSQRRGKRLNPKSEYRNPKQTSGAK
jgi:carbon-monoxide dehydrogenase small subunit